MFWIEPRRGRTRIIFRLVLVLSLDSGSNVLSVVIVVIVSGFGY